MRRAADARGIVYVEFLISFLPFFLLFLGGVQVAYIAVARLVVRHAAVQAARAAVVVIDDDPYFDSDDGTLRKHVSSTGHAEESATMRAMQSMLPEAMPKLSGLRKKGCDRMKRIRSAAYVPLATLSPSFDQLTAWLGEFMGTGESKSGDSLQGAVGTSPWTRVAAGFAYNRLAAAVTFPEEPGAEELRDASDLEFADDDVVTVRVTYLYACNVPLARDLVCSSSFGMTGLPEALQRGLNAIEHPSVASIEAAYHSFSEEFPEQFASFQRNLGELSQAEAFALLFPVLMQPGERFVVLHGEASLPNQGAAYEYASERCKTKKKIASCKDES